MFAAICDLLRSHLRKTRDLQRLLQASADLTIPITDKPCIDENTVVPWHTLGQAMGYGWPSRKWQQPGLLSGWGPNNQSRYGSLQLQCEALANIGRCEITQNWSCDIHQIHGFSASKSDLSAFESTDAMVQTNSKEMISEISLEKLAENLAHREIRILHREGTSDRFERYAWDKRIWLINSGGSHHTAAAKYIASRLGEPVTLTAPLHNNRLNPDAVANLVRDFEMFVAPGCAQWFNDFSDAMESLQSTWYWRPAPSQLQNSLLLFLPRDNKRSVAAAALLRQHRATDLGAHLQALLKAQIELDASQGMDLR